MARTSNRADRPDSRTSEDLRTGVQALAEAITEPGIGRAERLTRARVAAEASHNVGAAVALLDPYADRSQSRLRDTLLQSVRHTLDTPSRDDAEDRLARYSTARAVAPTTSGQATTGRLPMSGAVGLPSPFGGTYIEPWNEARTFTPWLLEYGILATRNVKGQDIQPEPWDSIPEAQINVDVTTTPLTANGFEITGDAVEWDRASLYVEPSRQLLDWVAGSVEYEEAVRASVLIGLETALIARLLTMATVATTFKAAESAAGVAWPGGTGPDLVLTSSGDLPKVRRLYADENLTDPTMRPRILATAGVPDGTALVMVSAAVNVKRTDVYFDVVPVPSTLSLAAAAAMDGAVSLRAWGTVAKVNVAALDTDPVPAPLPRA